MSKILYFLGGVAAGSVATYFALRMHMERRIEEEVESVREVYKERKVAQNASTRVSEQSEANVQEIERNEFGKLEKTAKNAKDLAAENAQRKADLAAAAGIVKDRGYSMETVDTHATAYNLFSKPPKASDIHNGVNEGEELDILVEPENIPDTIRGTSEHPYTISPEQFVNEHMDFDKTTLMYYADGVLIEEMSREVITDIDKAVGYDSLQKFGEFEEDVVYVRNERISTDFEIIQNEVNFTDVFDDGP